MKNKKVGNTKSTKMVILLIISAIMIGSISGAVYALFNTRIFEEKPKEILDSSPQEELVEEIEDEDGEEIINFLLVGVDESKALTDVIMIIRLDTVSKQINILQVPRDTYVGDDIVPTGKINSIYNHPNKGETSINALKRIISQKFKIKIDNYATITLDKFREVVDILGGVPVDVKQDLYWDENYTLEKGKHLLSGWEAEVFIRYRKGYATGDIGRMGATKQFMESLIEMMFDMSTSDAVKIAGSCYDKITTDLTINEILKLYNTVKKMDKSSIEFFMVPGDGVSEAYNGHSIYAVDVKSFVEMLNESFRSSDQEKLKAKDIDLEDVYLIELEMANGGGITSYSDVSIENDSTNNSSKSGNSGDDGDEDDSYTTIRNGDQLDDDWYDGDWEERKADNVYDDEDEQISSSSTSSSTSSSGSTSSQSSSESGSENPYGWWNEDGSYNSSTMR